MVTRTLATLLVLVVGCSNDSSSTAKDAGILDAVGDQAMSDAVEKDAAQGCAVVDTKSGPVQGVVSDQSCAFLGVPFAKPPVGDLRWKPPQQPEPWSIVRVADEYGSACPQYEAKWGPRDEDCLTLNVWAPHPAPADPAPVMVWINKGEGFIEGSSRTAWTDGTNLASWTGTIVVSFNFRLSALGWLAHPDLGTDSGNYGFLDQVAVLQWVQDNISAFGGDPDNVTIFGGGMHGGISVCLHMVSPKSTGLFHRAIMQSGFCPQLFPPQEHSVMNDRQEAEAVGQALAQKVGCDQSADVAACLREKSPDEVNYTLVFKDFFNKGEVAWGPVIDGETFTGQPHEQMLSGDFNKVPLLIGSNQQDGIAFLAYIEKSLAASAYEDAMNEAWGDMAAAVLQQYPVSDYTPLPGSARSAAMYALRDMINDLVFVCPSRRTSRVLAAAGLPVYLYHFVLPINYGDDPSLADPFRGTGHAAFKTYVFHTPQEEASPGWQKWIFTEEEEALSQELMGYWTRFARTGDPNGDDAVTWPRYEEASDKHLLLDATIEEGSGLRKDTCDFWDSVMP